MSQLMRNAEARVIRAGEGEGDKRDAAERVIGRADKPGLPVSPEITSILIRDLKKIIGH